jgi:lipoprotein signal peptidase
MMRVLALLLGAATVVAAIDIAYKAHAISERGGAVLLHDRPTRYVVAGAVLSLGWAGAVTLTRSSSIAFAGGVVLGGAAGNLVSFALWPSLSGVPDPILAGGLAFSLGDVAVLVGFALLIPSVLAFRTQRARLASAPATGEA